MAKSLFFLGRKIIPRRLLYTGFRRKVGAKSSGLSRDAHSGRGAREGCRAREAAGPREHSSARLPAEAYRVLALPAPPPQLLTESSPSCVESPRTNAEKDSELGEKGGAGRDVTSISGSEFSATLELSRLERKTCLFQRPDSCTPFRDPVWVVQQCVVLERPRILWLICPQDWIFQLSQFSTGVLKDAWGAANLQSVGIPKKLTLTLVTKCLSNRTSKSEYKQAKSSSLLPCLGIWAATGPQAKPKTAKESETESS
ncbi:uncharacterized protein LOC115031924 [Mus caroli]|uniref:Uncharacterized protein LOC115031924 n=1 Tax=Mus caroli TaxID=10089 RepID=A0A6P7RLZ5_MUSCR|nr:uncharacterized protein LOC115031924 [Mus caroli]